MVKPMVLKIFPRMMIVVVAAAAADFDSDDHCRAVFSYAVSIMA